MTLYSILWGIAGYISFFVFQLTKPIRIRSGWDFVVQTAFFALICYLVARALVFFISLLISTYYFAEIKLWWHDAFGPTFTLVLGIILAAPLGIIISLVWRVGHTPLSQLVSWVSGKERNLEFTDIFFAFCDRRLGELILISLKSGKVYVGILSAVTEDPNEGHRCLELIPVVSGYRNKETQQLTFDTNYIQDGESPEKVPNRNLLIAVNEVVSIANFDQQLHEKFIKLGITKIDNNRVGEKIKTSVNPI